MPGPHEPQARIFAGNILDRHGGPVPAAIEYTARTGEFVLTLPGRVVAGVLTGRADRDAVAKLGDPARRKSEDFRSVVRRLMQLGGGRGRPFRDVLTRTVPIRVE